MTAQQPASLIWITILIFVAVFAVFTIVLLTMSGKRDANAEQRLNLLHARATGHAKEALLEKKHREIYQSKTIEQPSLERLFERLFPRKETLKKRIEQAGWDMEPGRFLFNSVFAGCFGFFIGIGGLDLALGKSFLLALFSGIVAPHMILNRMIAKRKKGFLTSFPDALDLIVRSLKAGLPISQSMQAVSEEMKGPLSEEFSRIDDEIRLGKDLEDSLWDSAHRIDLPDFRFFVISLSVQRQTGGNLAETLDNLSEIVRKRAQLALKIKAMSSEARASAYIIGALPFVMMSLLYLLNRDYISLLFTDPRGHKLLLVGVSLLFTGAMVMRKMVRFEV